MYRQNRLEPTDWTWASVFHQIKSPTDVSVCRFYQLIITCCRCIGVDIFSNTWSLYLTELTAGKDDWSNLIIVTFAVKMILRDICIIIINLMIFTGVPRARFSPEVHDETQPCKRTRISSTRAVCCIDSYRWTRYQMERWRPFKPRRAGEQVFWRPRWTDRRLYVVMTSQI